MKKAFTLTEVLIASAIVGVLAAILLPHLILTMQNGFMDEGFKRAELSILTALDTMPSVENTTFAKTSMYLDEAPTDYDSSSGAFMRKYLKIARVCKEQKDCFADKYYLYTENNVKQDYELPYDGYCAILKSGASLCLKPQIDNTPVWGIMDINGTKGPNVLGRDLRELNFDVQASMVNNDESSSVTTAPVGSTPNAEADRCTGNGGTYYQGHCFLGGHVSYEQAVANCQSVGQHLETNPSTICTTVATRNMELGNVPNYSCLTYWTGPSTGVCCQINHATNPRSMDGSWRSQHKNPNGQMCSP